MHRAGVLLEPGHERVGGVVPDGRERPIAHAAQVVVPPHGVGVDVAQVVDVGHHLPAGVAAPAGQALGQGAFPLRQVLAHPVQQEGAVGIVVAADVIVHAAGLRIRPGAVKQQVHGIACCQVVGILIAVDVAAPGVVQVREVELVRPFVLHQLQQVGQVVRVHGRHGEAQAHLHAKFSQKAHGGQAAVKGPVQAAKFIVRGFQSIQADAYVVKAFLGDALGQRAVNQRAVGREAGVKAQFAGLGGNFKNIRPQEWLAAGQNQRGHAKAL